ncbi:site-specific DNA recombinase [Ruminococcus sp. YRD2003]|uniref:recombinase family protein n=1 Tax=Ruminococcus sp. YRD2003 TaxID=1452313 RepID=UPI0008CCF86F|nr:site-specific DNA recombinase [Ruminococcus flavefaciens]
MSITIHRVAQYARFSSDNQRTESIDAQLRAMNQFCKQQHWQVVATYTDEARSATTDNRPQFQQMISDSSKGIFDIVLVHKLDRFSRDRYDSAIYKKRLKKNNVQLCSVLERIDDSPESIMMESVLEGMAEYYSRNLGREVMKGMKETALQCKHTGGCPPLGYDVGEDRKLVINKHEAEAVRIIFEMYADGQGYSAIIDYLNEHGYTTKRGQLFGKNSLYEILNNEKYTGVFVFNRAAAKSDSKRNNHAYKTNENIIRVPGGCPAIIRKALFEKVQRVKAENRRSRGRYHSKEFYLLTGKVFCGVCGKRIQGNLRFSGERKNRLCTYRCDEPKQLCKNKENNKDYLDAYVADLLRQKIFNKASLRRRINAVNKYIAAYNAEFDEHYDSIKSELEEVTITLSNITAAVEKGVLTDAIIERSEALEQRKNEIQAQLAELRRFEPLKLEEYLHLIGDYKQLERNTPEFRSFVQMYVDKVVTYPYHIEVTLDVGFGVTDELKETITIRRGELYALFESRTED